MLSLNTSKHKVHETRMKTEKMNPRFNMHRNEYLRYHYLSSLWYHFFLFLCHLPFHVTFFRLLHLFIWCARLFAQLVQCNSICCIAFHFFLMCARAKMKQCTQSNGFMLSQRVPEKTNNKKHCNILYFAFNERASAINAFSMHVVKATLVFLSSFLLLAVSTQFDDWNDKTAT